MAYLKPGWFTRAVFNNIAMATGMSNTEKLTVTRRRSKQSQDVPVIPVDVGGTRYVVSTRGESEWVKNVLAVGGCELKTVGKNYHLSAPKVVHDPTRRRFPMPVRPVLMVVGADEFDLPPYSARLRIRNSTSVPFPV